MPRKSSRNTRGRIISAAWKLFYEQGYDDTTVEDIVFESETSKGSFYHYFDGKDSLMGTLAYVFDEKYEELERSEALAATEDAVDKLVFLNHELYVMIESSISIDLLTRLLSTQLVTTSEKHLMDQSRYYFRILRKICTDGQRSGQLRQDISINEMVRTYALQERALLYDWCICGGNYSLSVYATSLLPNLLSYFKN